MNKVEKLPLIYKNIIKKKINTEHMGFIINRGIPQIQNKNSAILDFYKHISSI